MNKLIKLFDTYYVIIDDSEIKEDNFGWDVYEKKIFQAITYKGVKWNGQTKNRYFKITHSTHPLEGIELLSLLEVEEAIYGYSGEELAKRRYVNWYTEYDEGRAYKGFINGFEAHQELVKDKLFTIEDMEKAITKMALYAARFGQDCLSKQQEIIQSLLPKTEWDVEITPEGKIKLI